MNKRYPASEMKGKMELYDSRAPPRRRVKGEDADDQPIFLRKAYTMMNTCPPEIGGWSEEGDAIVVKDMKLFAQSVIPTAYRHNNFASFVRQLNFYGFRKVKSDSLERAHWWIFRHPYFLRGQPHLISEIKRSVHFANEQGSGGKEVGELKNQVSTLSDRLAALTDQVDRLALAVNGGPLPVKESKKRKTSATTSYTPVQAVPIKQQQQQQEEEEEEGLSHFDFDYFMELEQKGSHNDSSNDMSIVMIDDDNADHEFDLDMSSSAAYQTQVQQQTQQQQPDHSQAIAAVKELSNILSSLTPELKERFVDKLAEVMGTQLVNNMAVEQQQQQQRSATPTAVVATAAATTLPAEQQQQQVMMMMMMPHIKMEPEVKMMEMETQEQDENAYFNHHHPQQLQEMEYMLPSGSKAPSIALPLASATLGAFLTSLHALKYNVPPTPGSFAEAIAAFA